MSKRLGTPYKRGNSDVIDNFAPNGGTAVAEGVAVAQTTDGRLNRPPPGMLLSAYPVCRKSKDSPSCVPGWKCTCNWPTVPPRLLANPYMW